MTDDEKFALLDVIRALVYSEVHGRQYVLDKFHEFEAMMAESLIKLPKATDE